MTALALILSSLLVTGTGGQPTCSMNPLPLDVKAIRSSKDVRSFVADSPLSASILLSNGNIMRVRNMGCADSGGVAKIWMASPPKDGDYSEWRKLFIELAKIAFGSNSSDSFASWVPKATFTGTDRFVLTASTSGDVDMSINVQRDADGLGDVVTMSFTYH